MVYVQISSLKAGLGVAEWFGPSQVDADHVDTTDFQQLENYRRYTMIESLALAINLYTSRF